VYRDFKDAGELIEEISQVISQPDLAGQPKLFQ